MGEGEWVYIAGQTIHAHAHHRLRSTFPPMLLQEEHEANLNNHHSAHIVDSLILDHQCEEAGTPDYIILILHLSVMSVCL